MEEQGIFGGGEDVRRERRAGRGEAPPFAPAVRAVVQERGGEAAGRGIRVGPCVEVAVEEPAAGRGREVVREAERRAGRPDGGGGLGTSSQAR